MTALRPLTAALTLMALAFLAPPRASDEPRNLAAAGASSQRDAAASGMPRSAERAIRVHGHWVIEVRNPDGTLAHRHEFENDPTNAAQAISTVLTGSYTPGYWWVTLGSTTGAGPACLSSGSPVFCRMIEAADGGAFAAASNSFKTLAVSRSNVQSQITLTGTINAQRDGDINTVAANMSVCNNTTPPSTPCGTFQFWPFTSRTLGTPISLTNGQQALVTVTLSFN